MLALLLVMAAGSALAATGLGIQGYEEQVSTYSINPDIPSYADYCAQHDMLLQPEREILLEAADAVRYEEEGGANAPVLTENAEGREGLSVLTGEEAVIEWDFEAEEAGWYDLEVEYYPWPGRNAEIQRAFFLDGVLPYRELALVNFSRVWRNDLHPEVSRYTAEDGTEAILWRRDNQGNELKPSPGEAPDWRTALLQDSNG